MKKGGDVDLRALADLVDAMRQAQDHLHTVRSRTPQWSAAMGEVRRCEQAVDAKLEALGYERNGRHA